MGLAFRQVHLDFHTSEAIDGIGAKFSKVQFQQMLKVIPVTSIYQRVTRMLTKLNTSLIVL